MWWMGRLKHQIFALLLGLASVTLAQNPVGYVERIAQPGEGVLAMLRAYDINSPCNLAEFYRLNQLDPKKGLVAQKNYLLPIRIYAYNGTSIRSTLGSNDLDWARSIEAFNDQLFASGKKPGDYRKDRQLWVAHHFFACPEELASRGGAQTERPKPPLWPASPELVNGRYPIFGEPFSKITLESNRLEGRVFYLVSGHGGPDPGALGNFGGKRICEDEMAYDVTLRLARNLLAHNALVYLIVRDENDGIRDVEILPCDKDETVWPDKAIPLNQKERLYQRVEVINALYEENEKRKVKSQRLIEIHIDSYPASKQVDVFFYHRPEDLASYLLAETMRSTVEQKYRIFQKQRGYTGFVKSRDLLMLRETLPTAVFIELGNIWNAQDQARLIKPANRQALADWFLEALIREAAQK